MGNPDLKPEQMEMWELAVDYRPTSKWRLAVNLFTYQARDKIVFLPDPETNTRTAQNAGSQEGRGLEMETQWQVTNNWVMLGNYAFQHATNNEDDNPGNAPQQQGYLRSDWQFWPQWHFNMQAKWVANRYRVPGDSRPPIDDYTWVDLTLRRQLVKEHWDFAVSVRNLLDADARELSAGPDASGMINTPHDLPLAGRNYWLEMRYRF